MSENGTALVARGLHKSFGKGSSLVEALQGVDVTIQHGALTAVTGPSGAGKTTLLNLLCGLDRPDAGSVLLDDGRDIARMSEAESLELRRRRFGYVFQTFGLIPVLSAAENVEVPLRLAKVDPRERSRRVAEVLDRVGLSQHAQQRPGELSGGQQQRVGIARALVSMPDVLIADEPTGQLDSDTAATIMELISELTLERGIAAVVSTHDPLLVARSDAAISLLDGRVV